MEYGDEGYLIHLGLERREARMTRAQIDRVVEQLLADVDFVATVRNHVATVDAYIASLRPDVPEDLGKRPSVDHLHRIQKEIVAVTGKTDATIFASFINHRIVNVLQGTGQ
jgi:hypothetical protein